ncbi:MAG TPA: amidohydrolase family protein [Pyrinomonadaceae bacterium]|nr:amidohydrolase family protein [Pyrinomonadaceae bacterium]
MIAIYTARWVLPIVSSAIADGAVAIDGSKIVSVGPRVEVAYRFPGASVSDFGQAAMLPGLVNAHSHLEVTVMRGFLESEEHDFAAWLRKLTTARMAMTGEDLLVSATCGAVEAARAGVTCVGDSSSSATHAMKALGEVGLRGIVYQESFGPDPKLARENVANLRDQIAELRTLEDELVRVGVSPHAPYTVSAPQLELISRLAIDEKLPLMMHAAESQAEKSFMLEGLGRFAEGLKARGIEWQAPGISTIEYLARQGILETRPLLAHCINVDDADLELIKQSGAGIAHCPKSNAKLGHGRAPFQKFLAHGVHVGLGSDSVASNNTCDILEEARFATLLARVQAGSADPLSALSGQREQSTDATSTPVGAEQSLFAATLGGSRALGLENQIGALAEGMRADITVVSLNGTHQQPVRDPADTVVFSSSGQDVVLTMVAGKEIYRDGHMSFVDEGEQQSRLETIRTRLDSLG